MKKVVSIALLLLGFTQSQAQDGLFIRAQAGYGSTKIKDIATNLNNARLMCDCGYDLGKQAAAPAVEANAEVGYQYKRVRLITGLQLISTRDLRNASSIAFPSGITYTTPITDVYSTYYHLLVPVGVSFRISLPGRSNLYPEIGTRLAFLTDNDKTRSGNDLRGRFFSAKLNYEYSFTKNLSLIVTPAYYSMAAPVYYVPANSYNRLVAFDRSIMLQAGILWHLSNVTSEARDKKPSEPALLGADR